MSYNWIALCNRTTSANLFQFLGWLLTAQMQYQNMSKGYEGGPSQFNKVKKGSSDL